MKVAVLGAGQMGGGIAHVCALAGLAVEVYDCDAGALGRVADGIAVNLRRQVRKGAVTAEAADAALGRVRTRAAPGGWLGEAAFVIEAVNECFEVKRALFVEVGRFLGGEAVLATNTSSYSIGELAVHAPNAGRFVGMHFMNPVPMMPLVEVVGGVRTEAAVVEAVAVLARRLGMTPVFVQDYPGFVANRVLMPMLNEAMFVVFEGVGGVLEVDRAMVLGMRHPMGPLRLADFIGLDTCLAVLNVLYAGFLDAKFRPCPLLKKLVAAGCLGRKSGVGFYDYRGEGEVRPQAMFGGGTLLR